MGSGKSTVGRLLAESLGWDFVDLDDAVEQRVGRTIPRVFAEEGEEAFRVVEARMAEELLAADRIVLASGGGWPCREGRMEAVPHGTLSVWLQVSPEGAFERVRRSGARRPLLEVDRPLQRIRELLEEREPYYGKALWWLNTEVHPPEDAVRLLADRFHQEPERPLRA